MPSYSTDRRSLLKIIGAIGATCAYPYAGDELFAQAPDHAHAHAPIPTSASTQFFNERDMKTIARMTDLIVPETDTPGASAAGVPAYIDAMVARNTDHQLVMADGLRWLDAEAAKLSADQKFVDLTEAQQVAILQPLCEAYDAKEGRYSRVVQFFSLVKNLTADGYYTSYIGLIQELGFKNEMSTEYPGCSK
ncbi:MAG: gluconate 2-dehydrogenase subunit 3 family protein [Acidobacteriaceae bacterium]|nr:gluconate 2-dehydrogenase subunit 3 family protein [Acidobacteriaceae bacterium]